MKSARWCLIVVMLANIFIQSHTISLVISFVGVLLFAGLTAYDTQKIKQIYYHVQGIKAQGFWAYLKHFAVPPGSPVLMAPLMLVIELISHIARPISLGIRLMANMMADHLVLGIFLSLLPIYLCFFTLPMYLLGSLVVVVQALVFCLLSTVYIAMAIEHAEH